MNEERRVKICGVSEPATARFAACLGANYVGIVFYRGSHRYVTPARASEIAKAAREHGGPTNTKVVGLFVNEPIEHVMAVVETAGLDLVQLSGDEPASDMRALRSASIPFLATVRAGSDSTTAARERFAEIVEEEPYAVHLDTAVPGMWGGSGVVGDWELARDLARDYRLFLAGGLDVGNVRAAVEQVRPFVVDVSSGVETDKIKDHEKIRAFIAAARGQRGDQS